MYRKYGGDNAVHHRNLNGQNCDNLDSILCDFPRLFQSVQKSRTFPWLENAFPFSKFSSPSGNPVSVDVRAIVSPS